MEKKLIFGSMLAIFLIAMLPTTCAVESNFIDKTLELHPVMQQDLIIKEFENNGKNRPEPTIFLIFLLHQILNILRIVKFSLPFILIYLIIKGITNTTGIVY